MIQFFRTLDTAVVYVSLVHLEGRGDVRRSDSLQLSDFFVFFSDVLQALKVMVLESYSLYQVHFDFKL